MKRLFITAMLSIAAAGTALAADLPQPPPPPQAPVAYIPTVAPVYNWGGIYVGINGGWGFGQSKWTVATAGAFAGGTWNTSDNGGVVGGTVGANFQRTHSWSVWRAIGIIPASTPAPARPSAVPTGTCQVGTIGWPQFAARVVGQ